MIEVIGSITALLAISGVILNNYRLRFCFVLWLCSNLTSLGIHAYSGLYSLAVRDGVFFVLAIHGLWAWRKKA